MTRLARASLACIIALSSAAHAQPQPPAITSPEVHSDGRVTFRLRAEKATAVTVAGEWSLPGSPPNQPAAMKRDDSGVFSLTVGPLEPNIYIYVFNVDGMTIVDPVNPLIKLRARTSASMVEVPGSKPWEFRDVPHGTLASHTHAAKTLGGAQRQIYVYTPPGYHRARNTTRYPILYLLHGNNDLAAGWTMAGRAHMVLDNMIADKQIAPMIVVMPWGHALPFGARPPAGEPSNNDVFTKYLVDEVVPLVEGSHRVRTGRRARAVVGLSMGGAQALMLAQAHPDRFGSIGLFGAGMTRGDFEARYPATKAKPATKTAAGFDLFVVGYGREDGVVARAKELIEALQARGLAITTIETGGGHTYPVWRKLLVATLPLLFVSRAAAGPTAAGAP